MFDFSLTLYSELDALKSRVSELEEELAAKTVDVQLVRADGDAVGRTDSVITDPCPEGYVRVSCMYTGQSDACVDDGDRRDVRVGLSGGSCRCFCDNGAAIAFGNRCLLTCLKA